MKNRFLLLFAAIVLLQPALAQHRADQQHLSDPKSFSMIVFGDPQSYVKARWTQPIFELCTAWMADNVTNLNIKAVLFTGDMVNRNECIVPQTKNEDQTSLQMRNWVSHCLERLDNKVPYLIAGGNHDYGYVKGDEPFTNMDKYYTYERNSTLASTLVANYPNRNGNSGLENAALEIKDANWGKLLLLVLEWAPRTPVIEWAKQLCNQEKYKDHTVVLLTHSLLKAGKEAKRTDNEKYQIPDPNFGQQVWDKLIYPCSNIRLAICGHTGSKDLTFENNTAYRVDKNAAGKDVHQFMFNCQFLGNNGGDGWTRILEFLPDGKTIKATTYSPLFGISPLTKQYAHRTGKCDQFDMIIEK